MKEPPKRTRGRILLVDDDQAHRNFLERGLRYEGYQVRLAAEGQEGLELALTEPPDLILLDIMMPGMNGFAVARALHQAGLRVPIVFISASDEPETCEEARLLGVPLLIKPVNLDELLERIAQNLHACSQVSPG
ncbi:MAG TPA: response regulator [Meiothermus sp.]|jgi:DNA-binding response OmpR family regulator|nr:response regulator [Meiothermus sp.]